MEKIKLHPLFKIVDVLIQPLGWLSLKKAQYADLMLACTTADLKRILRIHNRQPNGLTEEQKIDIFAKIGEDVSWFEKFNADPNFRKETTTARQHSGSNEDPRKIEEKLKSLYYALCAQGLFPQTFEGQKLAVDSLNVYGAGLNEDVYKSSLLEFLLPQNIWNTQALQWLAEDAIYSAHSYNLLKTNPSSELIQKLAGYCTFKPHHIEPFLETNFHNINWVQLERQRGSSDISDLHPVWELALKELSESFVKQLIEKKPEITKKLRFTTVLAQRKNVSVELFEAVMLQEGMSVKRLLRKSRDPQGIVQAMQNNQVQSYTKKFISEDPYTKSVLEYLIHKETQQTRNNIVAALNIEEYQSSAPLEATTSSRRKM